MESMKGRSTLVRRKRKLPRVKIIIQDGRIHIPGMDTWYSYWRDPYHLLLTLPWLGFVAVVVLSYLGINTLFALLYLAGGDCIANATPGSFLDVFFFSVQTLASIGYGAMYPKTVYANAIVTIEAMIGLIGIAVLTGLAFARFSRPTARVVFSKHAVIAPYEGMPTLIFRTANKRRNTILEAQMNVYLLRDIVTAEGEQMRRIYDLKMVRNVTPNFTLSWLALHPIDEFSPLYGLTQEELIRSNATVSVMVNGIDETVSQVVHARHLYAAPDIYWNYRLVDIVDRSNQGYRYIDYNLFHEIEAIIPIDQE
jgi:inward rectifier potassium channel